MSGDGARSRVLETVDANWEREIGFLRGLVARRSTLGEEASVQAFVAAELPSWTGRRRLGDRATRIARLPG